MDARTVCTLIASPQIPWTKNTFGMPGSLFAMISRLKTKSFAVIMLSLLSVVTLVLYIVHNMFDSKKLPRSHDVVAINYYGVGCSGKPSFHERYATLLRFWETIAARRNITEYFLCFGTMLGASRDGDIVPYDHDIDICMFRKDIHKLEPEDEKRPFNYNDGKPHMILQRHCHHPKSDTPRQDCNGKVVGKYVDACSILDPCARILMGYLPFLDVFAIKDNGDVLLDEYKKVKHKRSTILPIKSCKLMGIDTKCPNNSTTYLRRYYGEHFAKPHYTCENNTWVATGKNVRPIVI